MSFPYPKIETAFERDPVTFRVDPTKIKNPAFACIKEWNWTEKIDGTNMRVTWNPLGSPRLQIGGRTDNAQLPMDLVRNTEAMFSPSMLQEVFPDIDVTFFGEGYGPGIQKGGGYRKDKGFILFDIFIKTWLSDDNISQVAGRLSIPVVPSWGTMDLPTAIQMVRNGILSIVPTSGIEVMAEGLVGRTPVPLFDHRGNRLIIKLKTKDFTGGHKPQ